MLLSLKALYLINVAFLGKQGFFLGPEMLPASSTLFAFFVKCVDLTPEV
jgi:hypothetical protein